MGSVEGQKIRAGRWMAWRLCERVWDEVVEVVGLSHQGKPESLYDLATVSELAYDNAVKSLRAELGL